MLVKDLWHGLAPSPPHKHASTLQCPPMLADALREARLKKGWSALHLSERSGAPGWVIQQIESGSPSYVPSEGNTALLAEALSLRFNHEGFCEELYLHRKTPRIRPVRKLRQPF